MKVTGASSPQIAATRSGIRAKSLRPENRRARRAPDRRHLAQAIAAAHDLPVISLADALELVLLVADRDPPTYDRAAARWLARYTRQAH